MPVEMTRPIDQVWQDGVDVDKDFTRRLAEDLVEAINQEESARFGLRDATSITLINIGGTPNAITASLPVGLGLTTVPVGMPLALRGVGVSTEPVRLSIAGAPPDLLILDGKGRPVGADGEITGSTPLIVRLSGEGSGTEYRVLSALVHPADLKSVSDAADAAIEAEAIRLYRSNLGAFHGDLSLDGPTPTLVSGDNRVLVSSDVVSGLAHYRASLGEFVGVLPEGEPAPSMVSADDRVLIGPVMVGSGSQDVIRIVTNDGQSNAEGASDGAYSLVYPLGSSDLLTLARGTQRDQWLGLATGGGTSLPLDGAEITSIAPMVVQFAPPYGTTAAEAAARARISRRSGPVAVWSNAEGGQSIANLLPDPPAGFHAFANTVVALERAQAVRPVGSRLAYEWMLMAQGESNTSAENLGGLHNALRMGVETAAQDITGQHEAVRMISWQTSSFQSQSAGVRSILGFALDHAEDATFICGGPTYAFPWLDDDTVEAAAWLHNSSRGHAMRGEMAAAIMRRVDETGQYLPLHAVSAGVTGPNEITVTLSEDAEAATDGVVTASSNLGLTLAGAAISSVSLSGRSVVITTSNAASGAASVSFGLTGQTSPRTEARIPRTNIRAKAALGTYSWGGQIRAWMCHQTIAIS